jgi:TRAP-type C4-dicarboxylate transport system permease small subunit
MNHVSRYAAILFGTMMLVLAVLVAVETIVRKVLGISLGGVDELSGYAIAVGGPLAFTVALIEQAHIRINLLHMHMSERVQAVMNLFASLLLAALAIYLFVFTVRTVQETQLYGSIAQTPWATPLIYPQALWLIAMGLFALTSVILALRALLLVVRVDWSALKRDFGPETVEEELAAELSDLQRR